MNIDDLQDLWGEANLHDALRFLALDQAAKCRYLPPSFEPRTFHLRFSDHVTGNPLNFMTAWADDLCQRDTDDPTINLWLNRLSGVLAALDYSDNVSYWRARDYWERPNSTCSASFNLWDALQHLSEQVLRAYGLTIEAPHCSCSDVLSAFSGTDDFDKPGRA